MPDEYEKNCTEVLFKCGRHCCICRRFRPTRLQLHHIIEKQEGGSDDIENLIAVCLTCHSDTHTNRPFCQRFTPDEFRRHRERVYEMVKDGTLVPPNDDAMPTIPAEDVPDSSHVDETFVITAEDGLIEPRLPKEAIEILNAAVGAADAMVLTVRTSSGYAVQVGGQNLVPSRGPRDEARFKSAVAELVKHGLVTGNGQVFRVTDRGFRLADELEAVRQQYIRSNVEIKDGMYYLTKRINGYSEGPFCTRCLDADGKLITLIGPGWQPGIKMGPGTLRTDDGRGYTCPECVRRRR